MAANIKRNRDKKFTIKLRMPNGDPYPGMGQANQVTVLLPNKDGTKLSINLDPIPAGKASAILAGVNFTAVTAGKLGNTIILTFDGIQTLATVVAAWNLANPSNQVIHNGVGSSVPVAGTAHLQNGFNTYSKVVIVNPAEIANLLITLPKSDTANLKQGNLLSIEVLPDLGQDDVGEEAGINIPNAINVAD